MMTQIPEALKFENLLKKVDADKDNSPLPGIDMAMFEDDVAYHDDLSNSKKYNDRYIEVAEDESVRGNFVLYLFLLMHNVFLVLLVLAILDGDFFSTLLALPAPLLFWIIVFSFSVGMRGGGVRFNRQAQLVHIGTFPGEAITVAWRDVKPYLNHGVLGGDLRFFFRYPIIYLKSVPWRGWLDVIVMAR